MGKPMTDLTREALVEAMADAAREQFLQTRKYNFNDEVAAALAALEALFEQHGLKVLPEEAAAAMLGAVIPGEWRDEGEDFQVAARKHIWTGMHRAAPWWPWEGE